MTISLRPYQQQCVEDVLAAYKRQPQGGKALLVLPTGCGKTIVFVEIARRLNLNTLIIAHRQELLQQAADKFRMVDATAVIGQVGAGRHDYGAPITVASIQTISRPQHLKRLRHFGYGLVIIDESHHSAAAGYRAVLDALPDAFVLGVTATPDRLDRQSIETIFGDPLYSTSIIDMVEQGYLCDLRAIAIRTTTSLDALHTQAGDYKVDELAQAIDTPERNTCVVEAYLRHCPGRQALCFAVTVAHAQHLAASFNEQGIPAAMVCGETPQDQRAHILRDYERGTIQVVCNVGVLTEGYDAPETSCIILARPTQSRALFVQAVGRGTRLAPGKRDCVVLDITDNCQKHRLQPVTLNQALEHTLKDGESVGEARQRITNEQQALAEMERQVREREERNPTVAKRTQDQEVKLLNRGGMNWERGLLGNYLLDVEVDGQKHIILLHPSATTQGYYSVHARLAPDNVRQQWLADAPLASAQHYAEQQIRLLQEGASKLVLVDRTSSWRTSSASEKQLDTLRKFNVPFNTDISKGEASDLISKTLAQVEHRRNTSINTKGQYNV